MYRANFGGRLLRRGMCAIFIGDVRHLRPIPSRSRAKMAYIPGGGVFRAAVSCRPCAVQPAVINISDGCDVWQNVGLCRCFLYFCYLCDVFYLFL